LTVFHKSPEDDLKNDKENNKLREKMHIQKEINIFDLERTQLENEEFKQQFQAARCKSNTSTLAQAQIWAQTHSQTESPLHAIQGTPSTRKIHCSH
jgi:hypothetical protein